MDVTVAPQIDRSPIGLRRKAKAFLALTKPRVVELLLVTTAPVMILAEGGIPDLFLVFATLLGGAMAAGSAGAFNCYIDRDIDRLMKRTSNRPLVTGELSDREALVFAWATGVVSIVWLAFTTNYLAAALALVADVPENGGIIKGDYVITQPSSGTFKAFSKVCTHAGCDVSKVDAGVITCPCHNSTFSIEDGSPTGGPAKKALPETKVKVDGDNIVTA